MSTGPWHSEWGAPGAPKEVSGVQVTEILLRQDEGDEALVALVDGRFALTGTTTFAIGTAQAVMRHARRRSRHPREKHSTWLLAVAEELSDSPPRTFVPR
ncbi:MAG: hypothetical protein AB7V58_00220 [Solirubrobacterales bacterium]